MKLKNLHIIQLVEYLAIMVVALPLYWMPRRMALWAGEFIGTLMYYLLPRRRQIGFNNLTIAFGDSMSDQERERILRSNFRNLGKSIVEVLHFPKMSRDDVRAKVTIVGQENCVNAMSKGRGMIYLAAHIGNWEMSSFAQSAAGYPANIVVRPLDNRYLNNFMVKVRTMYGHTILARRNGMRDMMAALKRKEAVGILMDQNAKRSQGIFVDFFGKPASTVPVIAILALRYDVPVIPGFIVRTGFDTHTLYFGEKIEIERTGDAKKDIELNTARLNKVLEDFIRQYPDQWFWIHNRWKTQPI